MENKIQINFPNLIEKIAQVQNKFDDYRINYAQCVFLLGLTGSGKSSLICSLAGIQLEVKKNRSRFSMTHHLGQKYPGIGNTNQSCTQIPSLYKFNNDPNFYYDLPGYLDSKGVQQDILNSYCNSKMFKVGRRAKIVMVVQISTIKSARGDSFVSIAKRLLELFKNDFRQIISCCLLVISKIDQDKQSIEDVQWQINQILEQNKNLEPEGVMLMKSLIHKKRIVFFPQPKFIKPKNASNPHQSVLLHPPLSPERVRQLRKQIIKLQSFYIKRQSTIALSQGAKNVINEILRMCEKSKCDLANQIGKQIQIRFKNQWIQKKTLESAQQSLYNLRTAKKMLQRKQVESRILEKARQFQKILLIEQVHFKRLKQWTNQVEFFLTICPSIKVNTSISDILLRYITQAESYLQKQLKEVLSKQQFEKQNKKHAEQNKKRDRQRENFMRNTSLQYNMRYQYRQNRDNALMRQLERQKKWTKQALYKQRWKKYGDQRLHKERIKNIAQAQIRRQYQQKLENQEQWKNQRQERQREIEQKLKKQAKFKQQIEEQVRRLKQEASDYQWKLERKRYDSFCQIM